MTNAPVESLVSAAIAFLERRPPFDVMEREALRFLIGFHADFDRVMIASLTSFCCACAP
jgi:hypothetical protein